METPTPPPEAADDDRTILSGQFLVAMPQLVDPNFQHAVVLLCEHNADGALGLIVNRPTPYRLEQVYEGQQLEGLAHTDAPIHFGGPVQPEMGFVLYDGQKEYEGSAPVLDNLKLGTSLDILRDISADRAPGRFLFFLGYSGWGADQLEAEIARNDWLVVPAGMDLLFDVGPDQRWDRAIRTLGVDPALLSTGFGTA